MISILNNALFSLNLFARLGVILAFLSVIALIAYKTRALAVSGALGAIVMGLIILWTTQVQGFLLLLSFFVSASVLSRLCKAQHDSALEDKGSTRDLLQVLANGLMAGLASLLYAADNLSWVALVMFASAIGEANSDTWAGEIGRFSKKTPVSMNSFLPVPKGESGGVTALGIFSSFLGSAFIAFMWLMLFKAEKAFLGFTIITVSGFFGSLVDSLLGAFVQAHYRDGQTGRLVEYPVKNGLKLEKVRGISWVDNDVVNLMSNVFSTVLAWLLARLLGGAIG